MRRFVTMTCLAAIVVLCAPRIGAAQDVTLAAPQALQDSGLFKYVLPRFSLKTGVRIELVADPAEADVSLSPDGAGRAVFTGPQATWRMTVLARSSEGAARFADWLTSEVGQRTIAGFEVDGVAPFGPPKPAEAEVAEISFDGDVARGKTLSDKLCGRCHVVRRDKKMCDIGSTPSFFVLRALKDWDSRFQSFYVLNPHPAFTQVADVTPPFHEERPPPIIPVEMTLDDLQAILAYVAALEPADLGAPIRHQ
ncbi:hypothetical protein [Roseovarius sp. PS-C2]|uniref:hypothetical protein n=1 Tax=Roseovarius sp. PS-C2 TaxID=2820814 RepID=UPI00209B950E|nr:hypothetical protein [Roseovarius sp. PS-C2]